MAHRGGHFLVRSSALRSLCHGWLQFEARPHHAYLFANRRANRMKVLVHDGIGVWLAARRLHSGKFVWPKDGASTLTLTRPQFDALVLGLPWQRLGEAGVITVL